MRPYLVFALIGLGLYLGVEGLIGLHWIQKPPSYTLVIILFLFFITSLIYRYIFRFASHGPETVTRFYLLSIVLKLLGGCSFIAAIMVMDKEGTPGNVVLFLLGYIIFTIAEVVFLMRLKSA
ncbi:MAG TPA: hypothetical protein VIT44_10095 [Cyclobacteriaceae bacterium]